MLPDLNKAFGLPESIDPQHVYVFRSGDYGFYQYWYLDVASNYWEYSNAPVNSVDYDPLAGDAIILPDQPMPHTAPQFYTPEGYKRNMGVPDGTETVENLNYDPTDPRNIWYEMYTSADNQARFVYIDADVKENLDIWVQSQLRLVDAGIPAYRKQAVKLFGSTIVRDRILGSILLLVDQGLYDVEELIYASVGDMEFIDQTVKLLGRKFLCDPGLLDFLTSISVGREENEPLFVMDTLRGKEPLGIHFISSVFASMKVRPECLKYWQANQQFSRIVHRMSAQKVPSSEVEDMAFNELARVFATSEDVRFLVDVKVRETLMRNYAESELNEFQDVEDSVEKSLTRVPTDDFGVAAIWSDLSSRRKDENEFSIWLHSTPLHDTSEEETDELKAQLEQEAPAAEGAENMPGQEGNTPQEKATKDNINNAPVEEPTDG